MSNRGSPLAAADEATGAGGFFARLDDASRRAVESEVEWVRLNGGQTLFRQGDPGDSLYIVIRGRLNAVLESPGRPPQVVSDIVRGEVVGEMAVLTGESRFATVRAVRDSALVKFSKDAFERVAASNPNAMLAVTRRIIYRLQQLDLQATPVARVVTIALLSADDTDSHTEVASGLLRALEGTSRVLALDSRRIARDLAGQTDDEIAAWLDEQERRHDYLLYVGDRGGSDWTSRCARQADRILLVTSADAAPDRARVAARLAALGLPREGTRTELVLVQPADRQTPRDTEAWLSATGLNIHHHVRRGQHADVERLARFLSGRAVGLVLGGGGARGFAHIGVIRALHEAGVPIDAIGGTSMGAVIAAQYAMSQDESGLRALNHSTWVDANPLRDKTLPVVALLACRRLDRMVADMFGDMQIADLWLPYFCVSTDLTRAEVKVHDRGIVGRAVRASMSLPGMAIPIRDGNSLLVDGGVLNNVPADVMKRLCGGKVIAVDVTPEKDLAVTGEYPEAASGWNFFFNRKRNELPSILAIIMRTVMLSSAHQRVAVGRDIDLAILPPIAQFGMFEWERLDEIIRAGYDTARPAIARWLGAAPQMTP
ncbi:MAG: cyclic nucleotide-binding and patatin-like phospholipase domain-containing protein [Vicinamibacterales bacterium]